MGHGRMELRFEYSNNLARCAMVVLVAVALIPSGARAEINETKLVPTPTGTPQYYGEKVALENSVAVVLSDVQVEVQDPIPNMVTYGCAFIWERQASNWTQVAQIIPSGYIGGSLFQMNQNVDTDGTIIALGAPFEMRETEVGVVYLIDKRDGEWKERMHIPNPDPTPGAPSQFGESVSIEGDWLAVGAPSDSQESGGAGATYIYKRQQTDQWVVDQKILGNTATVNSTVFGQTVALSGTRLAVAALTDHPIEGDPYFQGESTAAVYIFDYVDGQWVKSAKLTPTDIPANTYYSSAISLDGDILAIGGYVYSPATGVVHTVFVYEKNSTGWDLTAQLTEPDTPSAVSFGNTVSVTSDTILVADWGAEGVHPEDGACYVFRKEFGVWRYVTRFFPSDGEPDDYFGLGALKADGGWALVGAPHWSGGGNSTYPPGAAYVYELNLPPPGEPTPTATPSPTATSTPIPSPSLPPRLLLLR